MKYFTYFSSILTLGVLLLLSRTGVHAQEKTPYNPICQRIVTGILGPHDSLYLPFLPTISFNPDERIDFSLILGQINITGLSNVDVKCDVPYPFGKSMEITMLFNNILINVGSYSAGGHILNLPFNGQSYMVTSLEGLKVVIGFDTEEGLSLLPSPELCVVRNTTSFKTDIRKPVIYFDELNPGTDQGLLINTVASVTIPDIVDFVQVLLNDKLHDQFDHLVVGLVNKLYCNNVDPTTTTTMAPTTV